jgi:hypothetical protein
MNATPEKGTAAEVVAMRYTYALLDTMSAQFQIRPDFVVAEL